MQNEDLANTSIEVCAAVIKENNRFLLARRLAHSHCGLLWEFPGGKRKPGESLKECLRRELQEELGIEAVVGDRITSLSHRYEDRQVVLHFFWCTRGEGEPQPLECAELRWVSESEFSELDFPEADIAFLPILFSAKTEP